MITEDDATARLDEIRAMCVQAEPRHDQYEFAQAILAVISREPPQPD